MNGINSRRTYQLGEYYSDIRDRAYQILNKFFSYPGLITFNDDTQSVTFSTEKLIPHAATHRSRVMLLFSNPHPYSVYQGMFLSPDIRGREHPFWPLTRDAGWITISEPDPNPKRRAEICLQAKYQGPFELIFYCYYPFPTADPEEIRKIFGKEYFYRVIEPESKKEFFDTIEATSPHAVVAFNKGIFNRVSEDWIDRYIDALIEGKLIQSRLNGLSKDVPIFLTFPTGWRFHTQHGQFRKASLEAIKKAIFETL
ncbi:MAG: hypothetical protein M1281_00905 [Chloroflexi bacterium]|nr:hypothetical protein [Chloroflexota bacterium]